LDTSQQWIDTFNFSFGGKSVPCSQFHQALADIKWR
jgi:hypothetical protein